MKYKTRVWQPFRKGEYRAAWYDKKLVGVLRQFGRDLRCCHQRVWRGYCDCEVFSIYDWFLEIMPAMLEDFKADLHGCPSELAENCHRGSADDEDKMEDAMKAWIGVLDRMIFLFRESAEETCSRKNPYEDEWVAAHNDFMKKYGEFGEKLRTEEDKEEERRGEGTRWYTMSDVPEYQEIDKQYIDEEVALDKYRRACNDEALALFSKWFYDLWD